MKEGHLEELSGLINFKFLDILAREYLGIDDEELSKAYGKPQTLYDEVYNALKMWRDQNEGVTIKGLREVIKVAVSKNHINLNTLLSIEKDKGSDLVNNDVINKLSRAFTLSGWKSFRTIYLQIDQSQLDSEKPIDQREPHDVIGRVLKIWNNKHLEENTAKHMYESLLKAKRKGYGNQKAIEYLEKLPGAIHFDERYHLKEDPPIGRMIIIANHYKGNEKHDRTPGSEADVEALKNLAKDMRFVPTLLCNKTEKELLSQLKSLQEKNYSDVSMVMVFIMSHGAEDKFKTADWQDVAISEVKEKFRPSVCKDLADKPKLFFTQMCRSGKHKNETASNPGPEGTTNAQMKSAGNVGPAGEDVPEDLTDAKVTNTAYGHEYAHFYEEHSTMSGEKSFRAVNGSRYIKILVDEIKDANGKKELKDIALQVRSRMQKINKEISEPDQMQISEAVDKLTKRVYFPQIQM